MPFPNWVAHAESSSETVGAYSLDAWHIYWRILQFGLAITCKTCASCFHEEIRMCKVEGCFSKYTQAVGKLEKTK